MRSLRCACNLSSTLAFTPGKDDYTQTTRIDTHDTSSAKSTFQLEWSSPLLDPLHTKLTQRPRHSLPSWRMCIDAHVYSIIIHICNLPVSSKPLLKSIIRFCFATGRPYRRTPNSLVVVWLILVYLPLLHAPLFTFN